MKKFVLTLLVFCSINSMVMATTQVSYNIAGAVTSIKHGTQTYSSFGTRAGGTSHNATFAGQINHAMPRTKAMPRSMANKNYNSCPYSRKLSSNGINSSNQASQISRFNKNYTISAPKIYTRNGVTYYN